MNSHDLNRFHHGQSVRRLTDGREFIVTGFDWSNFDGWCLKLICKTGERIKPETIANFQPITNPTQH